MKAAIAFCAMFMLGEIAHATTWAPSEKTDPLSGEQVAAFEIASYGSYIYGWPSKYDLVFWPRIDANWICFNPKNGYAAFNSDFEKLPEEQKKDLADWLAKNYDPAHLPKTHKEKLAWLEQVYAQRKMDSKFWSSFYRLMAFIHKDDKPTSLTYVKKALPLLEETLAAKPEGVNKLETLYLLGEYNRRLGDSQKAEEYFSQVKDVAYKDEDGNEQASHPYFVELVAERKDLKADEPSHKPKEDDK